MKNKDINTNLAKSRNDYTKEFKKQVIDVWHSGAYSTIAECARSYQVPENTLYTWLYNARKSPVEVEANAEVNRLKKELYRAKMENEILKKAAIYFANHAR